MIVAVVGVVLGDPVEPLDVGAGEPVAEGVDAAVSPPVVVVGPMVEPSRLHRGVDRDRAVRPARLHEAARPGPELPSRDRVESHEGDFARRGVDERGEPTDDLLGDRDARTLEVVEALAPVAPLVVRKDQKAARSAGRAGAQRHHCADAFDMLCTRDRHAAMLRVWSAVATVVAVLSAGSPRGRVVERDERGFDALANEQPSPPHAPRGQQPAPREVVDRRARQP